jgi:hypothetical protein
MAMAEMQGKFLPPGKGKNRIRSFKDLQSFPHKSWGIFPINMPLAAIHIHPGKKFQFEMDGNMLIPQGVMISLGKIAGAQNDFSNPAGILLIGLEVPDNGGIFPFGTNTYGKEIKRKSIVSCKFHAFPEEGDHGKSCLTVHRQMNYIRHAVFLHFSLSSCYIAL